MTSIRILFCSIRIADTPSVEFGSWKGTLPLSGRQRKPLCASSASVLLHDRVLRSTMSRILYRALQVVVIASADSMQRPKREQNKQNIKDRGRSGKPYRDSPWARPASEDNLILHHRHHRDNRCATVPRPPEAQRRMGCGTVAVLYPVKTFHRSQHSNASSTIKLLHFR